MFRVLSTSKTRLAPPPRLTLVSAGGDAGREGREACLAQQRLTEGRGVVVVLAALLAPLVGLYWVRWGCSNFESKLLFWVRWGSSSCQSRQCMQQLHDVHSVRHRPLLRYHCRHAAAHGAEGGGRPGGKEQVRLADCLVSFAFGGLCCTDWPCSRF